MAVNDAFVMDAWARDTGGKYRILFLADGNCDFTRAAGLDYDGSASGYGVRCRRFSMIVADGVVTALTIEDRPGEAVASGAARILEQL